MKNSIQPGSEIGIFGSGQLGRMFSVAAARLGYRVAVFSPDGDTPAGHVSCREVRAPYEDLDAVRRFAQSVSALSFEFENVPVVTIEAAMQHCPVRPSASVLSQTQDRILEKAALRRIGIPLPKYTVIEQASDIAAAAKVLPGKSVIKTACSGYDGKGQRIVPSGNELAEAWESLGSVRAVSEDYINFRGELSVIGVRGLDGELRLYEPVANRHANHILDVSIYPAPVSTRVRNAAHDIARTVLEGLEVVGVLCVEMFELQDGSLVVNELAPRPHNSGHLTIEAHFCSQFEQQVRAMCGMPLGSTEARVPAAAMVNLLGDVWSSGEPQWAKILAEPSLYLHLYGKNSAKIGRKMGHITALANDTISAEQAAQNARQSLLSR